MGFLAKLFGLEPIDATPKTAKKPRDWREWDGEPFSVDLPNSQDWLSARLAAVPEGKRTKWQWVRLSTREQTSGKHRGARVIIVKWDGKLIAEVFPRDRAKFERLFEVVEGGVTAASCRFGWGSSDDAELTFGAHKYEPFRPWTSE